MTKLVIVADLVNKDTGKTYRQENNEKTHNIPLGSVVKVLSYDSEKHSYYEHPQGKILNVVEHGRDCDGTPLYYLHFLTISEYERSNDVMRRAVVEVDGMRVRGDIYRQRSYGGIPEESIKLIALPHEVIEDN